MRRLSGDELRAAAAKPEPARLSEHEVRLAEVWARAHCQLCGGRGWKGRFHPAHFCGCVKRVMFRTCLARYHTIPALGFRGVHYRCDFELSAKRTLSEREFDAFRAFFLHEEDYRGVAPLLGFDRGNFFHWVYTVEERLGLELYRRGVWPLEEYFATDARPKPWRWCEGGGVKVTRRPRPRMYGSIGGLEQVALLVA